MSLINRFVLLKNPCWKHCLGSCNVSIHRGQMNYLFILSFSLLVSSGPNELLSVSLLLLPAQEANIATLIKQMKAKKTFIVYNLYDI